MATTKQNISTLVDSTDTNYNIESCHNAAVSGDLELLKKLHKKNIPWSTRTCGYAAEYGHLPCLKFLHESGCEWDFCTVRNAAKCAAHLYDNPKPTKEKKQEYFDCATYAVKNGCSIDGASWEAKYYRNYEISRYLEDIERSAAQQYKS